jgi:hypothetical protein
MIDWKNWKTGAIIGFVYGLICALYRIPILTAQYMPSSHFPVLQCQKTCSTTYEIIGVIIFFPIEIISILIISPFYQNFTPYNLILIYSIIELLVGTALGAVFGYLWGEHEKAKKNNDLTLL